MPSLAEASPAVGVGSCMLSLVGGCCGRQLSEPEVELARQGFGWVFRQSRVQCPHEYSTAANVSPSWASKTHFDCAWHCRATTALQRRIQTSTPALQHRLQSSTPAALCPVADHNCGPAAGRVNQARLAITCSSQHSSSRGHRLAGDRPKVHKNVSPSSKHQAPPHQRKDDVVPHMPYVQHCLQEAQVAPHALGNRQDDLHLRSTRRG